ncbi:diguanylate cyclase [Rhodoferax sp. 4810]|uniref:diguanylate cyclase n=1 Tax=Thiospirillum jenense TaxID=1653858 RepID=A0A839HHL3_9GAMM|nr:diguanylate cyclase [Thiospirillum jenense]MBB1074328.1 diguanylate cyclase [Rhodoferax jenense]MBB1126467.1 diguanylate cyclase [Thiospirillum jenense]
MKFTDIPDSTIYKWQDIIDLVTRLANVRVGLIMRVVDDVIEVLIASNTANNPYSVGDAEHWIDSGLYCETVIKTQTKLLVPNALQSAQWCNNPDLKFGLPSYLGFPIRLPNGQPLGTICVLDDKENHYSADIESLMIKMRDLIEYELQLLEENHRQRLFAQQSLLRRILDGIPTALLCCSLDNTLRTLYLNPCFVNAFGYTQQELPTLEQWFHLMDCVSTENTAYMQSFTALLEQLRRQPGHAVQKEFAMRCQNGRVATVMASMVIIDDLLLTSLIDITDRKQQEMQLQRAYAELNTINAELIRFASTDPLTRVSNRWYFEEEITLQMAHTEQHHEPLSLILLDVDFFKTINDRYGHYTGDQVLIELCRRLKTALPNTERLARWGGEEFIALLPQCDADAAMNIAERMRLKLIAQPFPTVGVVTASFGVAERQLNEPLIAWFKRLDAALYDAKSSGRNCIRLSTLNTV